MSERHSRTEVLSAQDRHSRTRRRLRTFGSPANGKPVRLYRYGIAPSLKPEVLAQISVADKRRAAQ